ncbi:MAG: hypothetical protein GY845_35890 [Planctomycetes bacterium]|nr:hypothetical protein [Planctomycetota bacterium]
MDKLFSTKQVAQILGYIPDALHKAIWQLRLEPPQKGPSGNYLWMTKDIERAAWVLHCYDRYSKWLSGDNNDR